MQFLLFASATIRQNNHTVECSKNGLIIFFFSSKPKVEIHQQMANSSPLLNLSVIIQIGTKGLLTVAYSRCISSRHCLLIQAYLTTVVGVYFGLLVRCFIEIVLVDCSQEVQGFSLVSSLYKLTRPNRQFQLMNLPPPYYHLAPLVLGYTSSSDLTMLLLRHMSEQLQCTF